MRTFRWILPTLTMAVLLSLCASAFAQRVRNPNRQANAQLPTLTGKVVAYEPEKSITLEVTTRREKTKTEFAIVKGETKIELPPRIKDIEVGMMISVWKSNADDKVAARIGNAASGTPNPNPRANNNRRPSNPANPARPAMPQPAIEKPEVAVPSFTVRPRVAGLSPSAIASQIDKHIDARLATAKMIASRRCDDAEFIRRVYLDLVGVIPTADKVLAFLNSKEPDKRAALVDELLANPRYGEHFADLWCDRINVKDLPIYREPFIGWMSASLNAGRGWDEIAFDLLTAEGQFNFVTRGKRLSSSDPRALFVLVNTEEGMGKGPNPAWLAAESGRLFLGVQLQCAECHDHPFTETWKQTDFWGYAALFSQLRAERVAAGGLHWGERPVAADDSVRTLIPATALKNVGQEVSARLLGEESAYRPADDEILRHGLARWLTSPKNRWFAAATANRLWAHCFGRGLVNPVDDLRDDNPPTHPEVLQLLATELNRSQFDLKHLLRCICLSQTYQRTSQPTPENERDQVLYSHQQVKTMTPGVFYDSLCTATGWPELKIGIPERKTKLTVSSQFTPREVFVDFFRASQGEEADPLEYSQGIPQALKLANAAQLNRIAPAIDELAPLNRSQAIERIYLTTLARLPTAAEEKLLTDFLNHRDASTRAEDDNAVLWILINSAEFISNH